MNKEKNVFRRKPNANLCNLKYCPYLYYYIINICDICKHEITLISYFINFVDIYYDVRTIFF